MLYTLSSNNTLSVRYQPITEVLLQLFEFVLCHCVELLHSIVTDMIVGLNA